VRLDEFESVFRSAVKPTFQFDPPPLRRVLLVTQALDEVTNRVEPALERLLSALNNPGSLDLITASQQDWKTPSGLLKLVEEQRPDLVVTWRNLTADVDALEWDLGPIIHGLTQGAEVPVLLLPDPHLPDFDDRVAAPARVLVVTDHLTGDDRLVNWGVAFTAIHGHLHLAHIEDRSVFEHYMDMISRLPEIDTASARVLLSEKLLSLPQDYCESISASLADHHIDERVISLVLMGEPVAEYPGLVETHRIDLLICNTKDPRQRAMDSLAHALAVEIHHLPLLLL
jgi:hypothetical protein